MVYFADGAVQPQPVAGQQFVRVGNGDTVDIILQNLPANANGAAPPLAMDLGGGSCWYVILHTATCPLLQVMRQVCTGATMLRLNCETWWAPRRRSLVLKHQY